MVVAVVDTWVVVAAAAEVGVVDTEQEGDYSWAAVVPVVVFGKYLVEV